MGMVLFPSVSMYALDVTCVVGRTELVDVADTTALQYCFNVKRRRSMDGMTGVINQKRQKRTNDTQESRGEWAVPGIIRGWN